MSHLPIRKRRHASALAFGIVALLAPMTAARAADRPNVLWLISDDHAAYVTGCYGNTIVRTPNLDRLAAGGMRFDQAYCNGPICTASRAAFITGMYPRSVGVTVLQTPLPASAVTLGEVLKQAGYDTAWYGKTHFNSGLKHGFDEVIFLGEWHRWLKEQGQKVDTTSPDVLPVWKPFKDPARLWINGVYRPFGLKDAYMWDTWFARLGIEFITRKRDRPWCCVVSLTVPHSPFRFPLEYRDRHDPSEFTAPKIGPEDDSQIPEIFRDLTDDEKRKVQASYYTSTEFMDKNMGLVLDALAKSGQADNTIVVYIGDHGYMLGHHGRFEKHCSYQPAIGSPLLIRYPKRVRSGKSTRALVEFIDIMPTILDLCGLPTPKCVQGKSLVPLLEGKTDAHRPRVFVEYAWADEAMVRDERWKLVYIRGKRRRPDGYDPGEKYPLPGPTLKLFDTQKDPGEFTNLAHRPEQKERVAHYVSLLVDHLKRTSRLPDQIPKTDDPMVILDHCVQPHDVTKEEALAGK
ncbi:MAG: sulfatase-like hydrolase/transferase [Phycisphaerae bacterium]|nr:sulfatase-like hydrolase/transferase [Phycisphaerae bacterium]